VWVLPHMVLRTVASGPGAGQRPPQRRCACAVYLRVGDLTVCGAQARLTLGASSSLVYLATSSPLLSSHVRYCRTV